MGPELGVIPGRVGTHRLADLCAAVKSNWSRCGLDVHTATEINLKTMVGQEQSERRMEYMKLCHLCELKAQALK